MSMIGPFIAAVSNECRRWNMEIPCLPGRRASLDEKAEAERELVIASNRLASSSDYDQRKQFARELADALGRFLALE